MMLPRLEVLAFVTKKKLNADVVGLLAISGLVVCVFMADIGFSGLWHPDAPSHALNGMFYKDFVLEKGFLAPVAYGERYYAQYPNLTVGMYPPVFYVVAALLFGVFGATPFVAKLAVLPFSILAGNMFYLICRRWFPPWWTLCGSAIFVLQPVMLFGQKNVMLELPMLALSMVALFFLYEGTKTERSVCLFWAPVFAALAFLTKQNAIFLIPAWVFWITAGKKWSRLKCPQFGWGVVVGTMLLLPWVFVNVTVGRVYMNAFAFEEYRVFGHLWSYIKQAHEIIYYPVLLLAPVAFFLFRRLRNQDSYVFSITWLGSVVVVLLFVRYPGVRYAMPTAPPLVILSMLSVSILLRMITRERVVNGFIGVLVLLHAVSGTAWASRDVQGFDSAAKFVVDDDECVSVLYDGYFNSNFVFSMRIRDPNRRVFVFRASKMVFTTRMIPDLGYSELIGEYEKFQELLDRYAVKYIIQEETDSMKTPANKKLRSWIQGPRFDLIKAFPIMTRGYKNNGRLLVYKYLDHETKPPNVIELDMPMLGRKITVKVDRQEGKK
jgi:hypothetical protein